MNKTLPTLALLTPTLLLAACGGGGGGSSAAIPSTPVDAFTAARTSFSGSGAASTSSSGEELTEMLSKLNDPFDGANIPFVSVNYTTSQLAETSIEVRPRSSSISPFTSVYNQVHGYIGEKRSNGTFIQQGKYGAYFESDTGAVNKQNGNAGRWGYLGMLTDANDQPTAGEATYTGNSWTIYENRESAVTRSYSGAVSSSFDADFTSNTISGNSSGTISTANNSASLPVSIAYNTANIERSRFQASGSATIDGKNIPMSSRGAFFGPQAEELGFVAGNTTTGNISMLNDGYLIKQ